MNDLFTRSWQPTRGSGFSELQKDNQMMDMESGLASSHEFSAADFQTFLSKVKTIENEIKETNLLIDRVQSSYDATKSTVHASSVQATRKTMQSDLGKISATALSIKKKLEALVKENAENTTKPGCGKNSATDRQRTQITRSLGNKLREEVNRFNELQRQMDSEYRETVERRVYTVTGTKPNPQEVDQLIETGKSEEIFQRAVQLQGKNSAIDALQEMQERHDAVQVLTKNLLELHQVFQDMAILVESQGELVDDIEKNVEKAGDYTAEGRRKLETALVIKRNTRKWQMYGCIIVVVIIVIIVIICIPTIMSISNS